MTQRFALAAKLLASIPTQHTALAFELVETCAAQPNLPVWLASLQEQTPEERVELLRRAAQILRTELPDRRAALLLTRLADEPETLTTVLNYLPAAVEMVAITGRGEDVN
jgi:hypothetical protein